MLTKIKYLKTREYPTKMYRNVSRLQNIQNTFVANFSTLRLPTSDHEDYTSLRLIFVTVMVVLWNCQNGDCDGNCEI